MKNREAYREKLEAQMREWSAKIDLLKAKADQAEAEAKIEYSKRIEDLRQRKEALQTQLAELKNAGKPARTGETNRHTQSSCICVLSCSLISLAAAFVFSEINSHSAFSRRRKVFHGMSSSFLWSDL